MTLNNVLLIISFICLFLASINWPPYPASRVHVGWLGLALFVLTFILK